MIEFRVLGPLEVVRNGSPLALGSAKQRALLATFLLNANELLTRDRLIDELWGERAPPSGGHTLEAYVHRLRRILHADAEELLLTRPGGYLLRLDAEAIDLHRFERLLAEGRAATTPHRAVDKLGEALALWRGPPLADIEYEPAAERHVARLSQLRLEAVEERIGAELALGAGGTLVGELESLVAAHPLRERLRGQLMLALYRSGRQADALEVYRETRAVLVAELGLEPGPDLQELNRAILGQEPAFGAAPAEPAAERTETVSRGRTTSFVGRRRERRELARLLSAGENRLVTLTGAGGAGKTRLALELAAELGPRFRHGAVVVDLTAVSDPELVAGAVARSLGLLESPGRGAVEAVAGFLRGRELLLVLDNFEQVLDAAPLVAGLIAVPGPTILVTSRAPLRVREEVVYSVPPLELPEPARPVPLDRLRRLEAVRLFVDRAREARTDFELSEANTDDVAELCVRLDGLPLALELAAARTRLLSARGIVDRLGRRLDLLRSEAPGLPDRHRTLRAAIEWSYDLLATNEQRLFAALGAFVGGFTLDGAEAIAAPSGIDVLEGVEALLDNNLLRSLPTAGGEPRFGMLETIREFSAELLAAQPDETDLRRRHGAYYLTLAEAAEAELRGSRQLTWLERLDAELENVRAALDWAVTHDEPDLGLRGGAGLWRLWQTRSLNQEGRQWLERLLALQAEEVAPVVRANALAAAGRLSYILGDYDAARGYFASSLRVHRGEGTVPWEAMTLAILGLIALSEGDLRSARMLIEESVDLARKSRDWWSQSVNLSALGELLRAEGELTRARLALEESLRAARECGDLRNIGRILSALGLVALVQQEHGHARDLFDEALAVQRACGDVWNVSRTIANLGMLARDAGDSTEALRRFREALAMQAERNERDGVATSLELLSEFAVSEGRLRRAARLLSAAQVVRDEIGVFPMNRVDPAEGRVERLRAALGEDVFEEAWARGRSLMLDEVIADALEDEPGAPDLESAQPLPPHVAKA